MKAATVLHKVEAGKRGPLNNPIIKLSGVFEGVND
jgi:hypothetical protein